MFHHSHTSTTEVNDYRYTPAPFLCHGMLRGKITKHLPGSRVQTKNLFKRVSTPDLEKGLKEHVINLQIMFSET